MNVNKMAEQVKEFNEKITGITPGKISPERLRQRLSHIKEEIEEIENALVTNKQEIVDGFIDIAYLALGAVLEMGIPPNTPFDSVHEANMQKKQGNSTRNGSHEAIKPEGWQPPDHKPIIERMELLNQVSEVFIEATRLRIHKGANYNRGSIKRADHFPLGNHAYFTMMWIKAIRLRSLVESITDWRNVEPNTQHLIDRELGDLINYTCFWAEWRKGILV